MQAEVVHEAALVLPAKAAMKPAMTRSEKVALRKIKRHLRRVTRGA